MIPYDLIIPSASRPHLLEPVLETFFAHTDQRPIHLILHDDAVFPGKWDQVHQALVNQVPTDVKIVCGHDNPPLKHGPTLKWLLDRVTTPYCLYMQDDHKVVRDLPIAQALRLLDRYYLNQIRFNKRDTADKKGREGEEFYKVESQWTLPHPVTCPCHPGRVVAMQDTYTLCAADHWYFQCGLWRVSAIQPIVNWWMSPDGASQGAFTEHCEVKINQVMNGQWRHVVMMPPPVPCCEPEDWNDPGVRAAIHKTFIWGKIGEPRFVEHIGHLPEDWALERANRDPQQRQV